MDNSSYRVNDRLRAGGIEWKWATPGLIAIAALSAASALGTPAPGGDPLAVARREESALCSREAEQAFPSVLAAVSGEQPLYRPARSGRGGATPLLVGARFEMEARPGLTAQWMERILRCHEARSLLQAHAAQAITDDPFWLRDAWLEIDVEPGHAHFFAEVRGETASQGEQIHARAQALVAPKLAPPPGRKPGG